MRPSTPVVGLVLALVLPLGCNRCGPEEELPELSEVADEVQFDSVERLGPHSFQASIRRVRRMADGTGEEMSRSDEGIETSWKDWNHFKHRRLRAGELQSAVVVVDGKAFTKRLNARWEKEEDPEPYRGQLRATWRTWDEALEQFGDRIELVDEGDTVHEGRPAKRYAVRLAEVEDDAQSQRARRTGTLWPTSLEGFVVIDAATAVRLEARVSGVLQDGQTERLVDLELVRTGIGVEPTIERPGKKRKGRKKGGKAGENDASPDASQPVEGAEAPTTP